MNFEQGSLGKIPIKSPENKSSMDIYYEDISKKVLDAINLSENEIWKDPNDKNNTNPEILKKIKEKLSDPVFKSEVINNWNNSPSHIDFEDEAQATQIVRGLIWRLKEAILN